MKKHAPARKAKTVQKPVFPRGWNEKRVKEVIAFYDKQTEDEELAEYEAAMKIEGQTMMLVPTNLVDAIRQFIAERQNA
jgi:hypothetical protein